MEIIVIDRRDQVLTVKVKGGDEKVLAVKEKVRDNCNIRMDQINLKFKGILLDDGSALYNCGINEGDTILLDNGPSFQDLAVMYPYKKGRKAVRVWNTFDRNDIDRVVRNAREENLKEVEEGLSKWISSVLDFRVAPPLCLRLASGNELCMLLETVTGKLILGVHRNDGKRGGTRARARRSIESQENVTLFCRELKALGIPGHALMTPQQLENMEREPVFGCLLEVLRLAHPKGIGEISEGLLTVAKLPKGYTPQKKYIGRGNQTKDEKLAEALSDSMKKKKKKKMSEIDDTKATGASNRRGEGGGTASSNEGVEETRAGSEETSSSSPSSRLESFVLGIVAAVCIFGPPLWSLYIASRKRLK